MSPLLPVCALVVAPRRVFILHLLALNLCSQMKRRPSPLSSGEDLPPLKHRSSICCAARCQEKGKKCALHTCTNELKNWRIKDQIDPSSPFAVCRLSECPCPYSLSLKLLFVFGRGHSYKRES
ncbi:hypothetical protein, unlikely [Trypanosoma brucei gambiense DAL972]|uniref:T. brucei spp.-specific protein n=1 Tax=Trypanosoma brucei gambiense (strain MHOM/CI/86/DAL972) TaxID=679716 RepID=C9ZPT4_TRYB9|nr:hypothetical protein, unlikely [Trypanosoma brucei gambiense DAL972]CBH11412.1 hypothetical protein, unlikely [Trypanosoma brucei gambiense DAL972]|eukprot:XP_011773699.1 hypothetical protein, unlikely [Trypanosoma brucei gambiense DAL972]